jgi:hypothetical protein
MDASMKAGSSVRSRLDQSQISPPQNKGSHKSSHRRGSHKVIAAGISASRNGFQIIRRA